MLIVMHKEGAKKYTRHMEIYETICVKMETMLAAAEWNVNLYGYDPRTGHRETVRLADLVSL